MDNDCIANHPDFLSVNFFAKALASHLNVKPDTIEIVDLRISGGCGSGDNFNSDIYRVTIKYRSNGLLADKSVSLIVKAMPVNETSSIVIEELAVFDKEVHMYTVTLPRMSALLGGKTLSAKYIYSEREPIQIIVFEDLCASGYTMADRTTGIDEAHCLLVLDTLGKFHAASMVLVEQDAQAMDPYWFGMFKPNAKRSPHFEELRIKGLGKLIEIASKWPGYEATSKRLTTSLENFMDKFVRYCNEWPCDYKVLNHGDTWTNNYLFKYDPAGRPIDLIFVDYQLSFYSSPGIDINYFLSLSPNLEVRLNKRDLLLATYHTSFAKALHELRCPSMTEFTLERTKKEIESRELYALTATATILPFILRGPDVKGVDELFRNPIYLAAVKGVLQRFDELHVLEKTLLL